MLLTLVHQSLLSRHTHKFLIVNNDNDLRIWRYLLRLRKVLVCWNDTLNESVHL